jgi:hypothetical protein
MKATFILSTALFLVSAPAPDSKTMAELSAGFLAPTTNHGLMASDTLPAWLEKPALNASIRLSFATATPVQDLPGRKRRTVTCSA